MKTYNNQAMRLLREECRHEFWASYEPASDNSGGKPENECWERCYPYSWKSGLYLRFAEERSEVSIAITPCAAEHPMSFKVPDRLLTDGQCRMMINGIQFIQALLEANGLAAGKDHQFKGRYDAEKNAVIISLKNGE